MATNLKTAETPIDTSTSVRSAPTSPAAITEEMVAKRREDIIRFRTCCADPRASK
jgi:hypothetical protein